MNTSKLKSLTKNLSKDFPRSPRETIAGYVIAARTLDKCRATIAGTAGQHHFDGPLDNFFFGFLQKLVPTNSRTLSPRGLQTKRSRHG